MTKAAHLNVGDDNNMTPLIVATESGSIAGVEALMMMKADWNEPSCGGLTPLHWAAAGGQHEIAKALLQAEAQVDVRASYKGTGGRTPLHLAAREGHLNLVNALCAWKADCGSMADSGSFALFVAAGHGHSEIVAAMIIAKAEVNQRQHDTVQRTALMRSVDQGHLATVATLLSFKADPVIMDTSGRTCADYCNNTDIEVLLELHGVTVNRAFTSEAASGSPPKEYAKQWTDRLASIREVAGSTEQLVQATQSDWTDDAAAHGDISVMVQYSNESGGHTFGDVLQTRFGGLMDEEQRSSICSPSDDSLGSPAPRMGLSVAPLSLTSPAPQPQAHSAPA